MTAVDIRIKGKTPSETPHCFAPGEGVELIVEWENKLPSEHISLYLKWKTSGRGIKNTGITDCFEIKSSDVYGVQEIFMNMPLAPWSFSGELVSLTWVIEVSLAYSMVSEELPFVLGPDRTEVHL